MLSKRAALDAADAGAKSLVGSSEGFAMFLVDVSVAVKILVSIWHELEEGS